MKDLEMRKTMKTEMRQILTATKVEDFQKYKQEYFKKLQEKEELDFLKYLQQ